MEDKRRKFLQLIDTDISVKKLAMTTNLDRTTLARWIAIYKRDQAFLIKKDLTFENIRYFINKYKTAKETAIALGMNRQSFTRLTLSNEETYDLLVSLDPSAKVKTPKKKTVRVDAEKKTWEIDNIIYKERNILQEALYKLTGRWTYSDMNGYKLDGKITTVRDIIDTAGLLDYRFY